MKKWHAGLVVASILVAGATAHAQPVSRPISVYVQHQGDDRVGRKFVSELREQLHGSTRYRLAMTRDQALFILSVVSRDTVGDAQSGDQSAIATTLRMGEKDAFVHGVVQIVGQAAVQPAVRTLVATMDRKIEEALQRHAER